MEFASLFHYLLSLSNYLWVLIALIVLLVLFVDIKKWVLSAKFPFEKGVGSGAVEIACKHKKGAKIDVELIIEQRYQNKPLEIYLAGEHVCTIPAKINKNDDLSFSKKYKHVKPRPGDIVDVKWDDEILFSAKLIPA